MFSSKSNNPSLNKVISISFHLSSMLWIRSILLISIVLLLSNSDKFLLSLTNKLLKSTLLLFFSKRMSDVEFIYINSILFFLTKNALYAIYLGHLF